MSSGYKSFVKDEKLLKLIANIRKDSDTEIIFCGFSGNSKSSLSRHDKICCEKTIELFNLLTE